MAKEFDRKIVLEDGSEYFGYAFGDKNCDRVCEIVFNSSVVGYQEIISDPAYIHQAVVMTYPVIGNYGITDEDFESSTPYIGGLIVRDYNDNPSNFRYTKTLSEVFSENHIPGIYGLDTRKLTRNIRDNGSMKVLITSVATSKIKALEILASADIPKNSVAKVSCRKPRYARTANHTYNVVAVDCGIKSSAVSALNACGCNVTVMPYNSTADEVLAMKPDGVFVSSGPGNPENVPETVDLIKQLRGKLPIFASGLGHQLLCLAYGAKVVKMKHGHRGSYPVKNLETGKLECAAQSHGYVVLADSLDCTKLEVTHINLSDNSVEGVECKEDKAFSVQYYPESAPGPQDSNYLFSKFISLIKEAKSNA